MVSRITVGDFDAEPQPFMGSVISKEAADKLLAAQNSLVTKGGQLLLEMQSLREGTGLLSPGIVDATGLDLVDEEFFGPLLTVYRYKSFDEALELANNTRYGLGGHPDR